jgi:hypothetical protein
LLVLVGCSPIRIANVTASMTPATATSVATPALASGNPLLFTVGAEQARYVATVLAFQDAFNAGDVERALALFAPRSAISDCDHAAVKLRTANGVDAIRAWLGERAAEHDRFEVARIFNANPDPAGGSLVVGVEFANRQSDSLAAAGYPKGITPRLTAKVGFEFPGDRIRAWAAGPFGGPIEICRPT